MSSPRKLVHHVSYVARRRHILSSHPLPVSGHVINYELVRNLLGRNTEISAHQILGFLRTQIFEVYILKGRGKQYAHRADVEKGGVGEVVFKDVGEILSVYA